MKCEAYLRINRRYGRSRRLGGELTRSKVKDREERLFQTSLWPPGSVGLSRWALGELLKK